MAVQSLPNKLIKNNIVDNTNRAEVLQQDLNFPLHCEKLRLKAQLFLGVYASDFN